MLKDITSTSPMKYGILRYFNVAGADPKLRVGQCDEDATHLINVASLAAIGKRDCINIYGTDYNTKDGSCIRDYVHVSDIAEIHYLTIKYLVSGGESITMNCGYEKGYSVLEVVKYLKEISKRKIVVNYKEKKR